MKTRIFPLPVIFSHEKRKGEFYRSLLYCHFSDHSFFKIFEKFQFWFCALSQTFPETSNTFELKKSPKKSNRATKKPVETKSFIGFSLNTKRKFLIIMGREERKNAMKNIEWKTIERLRNKKNARIPENIHIYDLWAMNDSKNVARRRVTSQNDSLKVRKRRISTRLSLSGLFEVDLHENEGLTNIPNGNRSLNSG